MSTAAQGTFQGFAEAKVNKIPSLACTGYVEEVPEGKLSESQRYVVQPVTIRGLGASKTLTHRILYRPEWFRPGFDPSSLEEFGDEGKSMQTVYRKNINVRSGISALKGLAGSDERFQNLAVAIMTAAAALPVDANGNPTDLDIPTVQGILREHLVNPDGDYTEIGYDLRQRKDKAGEDENGKTVYELANGYEVGDFWFVSNDAKKKKVQRASRTADGSYCVAFDTE